VCYVKALYRLKRLVWRVELPSRQAVAPVATLLSQQMRLFVLLSGKQAMVMLDESTLMSVLGR
jgi:hypothetical protein